MAKINSRISKALQDTVKEHEHIDKVYFDAVGNHYFNAHVHKATLKGDDSSGTYARIHIQNMVDENGKKRVLTNPIASSKIVEIVDREDILKANAQSDLLLSDAMIANLDPKLKSKIFSLINSGGDSEAEASAVDTIAKLAEADKKVAAAEAKAKAAEDAAAKLKADSEAAAAEAKAKTDKK